MSYKLGSLFDGSGGFPLSGALCDIEPMWAAEVEPYPIAVTSSRFPNMKHLGDISKVNGAEIEPVDIITFGSPCQDLSVAGKRAGLKHEDNGDEETTRSGLFMEAVRIIKEMRGATNGKHPRFAVWENVPGAFSSNNGEDFRIVLQELIKIAEPNAVMPDVPKKGWAYADSYCGDGWSLAYRVFDAQHWGVPQRRRRIYLVADFRGGCAEEILFKREGLRGYFTQSRTQGQTVTSNVERSVGADDREGKCYGLNWQAAVGAGLCVEEEFVNPLSCTRTPAICYGISSYDSNAMKSDNPHSGVYEADTSRTLDLNGGNPACNQGGIAIVENVPYTLKIRSGVSVDSYGKAAGKGALIQENKSATLGTSNDQYLFQPVGFDGYNATETGDKSATLGVNCGMSTGRNGVIAIDKESFSSGAGFDRNPGISVGGPVATLQANGVHAVAYSVENHPADSRVKLDESGKVQTLTSRMGTGGGNVPMVMESKSNFIDVELEVAVRKHDVNKDLLQECLRDHKGNFTNKEIAEALGKPLTLVEHWFRRDNSFAIPDPDIWFALKNLLGIETTEFDQSIMEFEFKGGNYDMRNRIHIGDTVPTLTCGSGNNLHLLPTTMVPFCKSRRAKSADDATTGKHADVANTLNTFDQGEARANELVVNAYGLDRASFNQGQNAKYDFSILDDQQPTLTARGPGAVSYSFDPGASRDVGVLFIEECGKTLTNGTCPGHHDGVVISQPTHSMTTGSFMQINEEISPTLAARDYKDPACVEFYDEKLRTYIVRRLTPTECARLQGFPDKWGHITPKNELTEDEYRFWLEVRKTHDAINGRAVKDYNEKQMLTYYNKLWTDSAEYKMWGNGIALPCALYVLQGIKDALQSQQIC